MIARVAESCYWLMRYVERTDATARLLRVHAGLVLDTTLPHSRTWRPLLIVLGEEPRFLDLHGLRAARDGEAVQEYLVWDEANLSSIMSSVRLAREGARTVRETVSLEMWNVLNDLWIWIRDGRGRGLYERERPAFYEDVSQRCHLFHGASHNTMLHEEPFDFMRLGLNLERAGQTTRILDLQHHALGPREEAHESAADAVEWIAILRSCAAYEPFFKKRTSPLSGPAVAEFLLKEAAFPGSVLHALNRAENFLNRIRTDADPTIGRRSSESLAELTRDVEALEVDEVLDQGIHETLTSIIDRVTEVSSAVQADYFSHPPISPSDLSSEPTTANA